VSGLRLEQVHVADPATVFDAFTDPDAQHESTGRTASATRPP
jgi:hypothetical protein